MAPWLNGDSIQSAARARHDQERIAHRCENPDFTLATNVSKELWESVELRHVRTFLVVAEELHFGRAADRLRISQSRVSQLIRTFEAIVGVQLFSRNSRRVTLTPVGRQLRERVLPAYTELRQAVDHAREAATGIVGELRLGVLLASSGGPRLPRIISEFERRYPDCRVIVTDLEWLDPLGPLRRGEVDMVATRLPIVQPDLTVGPVLARDSRALAVADDHPLAGHESVSVEDLADYVLAEVEPLPPELLAAFTPSVTPSGRPIAHRKVTGAVDNLSLVARGEIVHATIASLPNYMNYPGITYVPIRDLPPSDSGLIWRTAAETAAIRAFAAVVEETT
jgi:DNA-binding transcriptional LysR family regulator